MALALPSLDRRPRLRAELRKLVPAATIFALVVGGYAAATSGRDAYAEWTATLPQVGAANGPCSLWFVGSSTVYKWTTLHDDMAPWDAHGRGVNGATLPQLTHRLANDPPGTPPAAIVIYAGENDIASGGNATDTLASFRRFMDTKTARFGGLPVIAVSLKPSPTRWDDFHEQSAFNDALRRYAFARDDLGFVDVRPLLLDGGRPGPYFVDDGVHLNAHGYARWTRVLHLALARMLPRSVVGRCTGRTVA